MDDNGPVSCISTAQQQAVARVRIADVDRVPCALIARMIWLTADEIVGPIGQQRTKALAIEFVILN